MDLKEYEQRKFMLTEIVRSAQEIKTEDREAASEASSLLARLAEDRFNLLIVGRFSRGKSTLMNALLGGDYLPTGIVPLTSVITAVRYGSRTQVVLNFMGGGLPLEIPLSRLPEFVTQKENPGNAKKIAVAEIQLPVELLRRGLYFVDTPGLGSAIIENSLTTERFLPQADAFVLVTSYESPLSEEEYRILERIRSAEKRLFVVLNKQDTISEPDRKAALDFVSERLQQFSFTPPPQIFSISARDALEARKSHTEDRLQASGLLDFEEALLRFLTEERAQAFLTNMFRRTESFLLQQIHTDQGKSKEREFKLLADQLRERRDEILGDQAPAEERRNWTSSPTAETYSLEIDRKTGCGVCGSIVSEVFDFLSKYQYELIVNQEEQQEHAQRGGFCPLHTWQYEAIASPQGVSESYPKVVTRVAEQLSALLDHGEVNISANDLHGLVPGSRCRLCLVQTEVEKRAISELAKAAQDATTQEHRVSACCVRHLLAALEVLGPGRSAERLLRSHAVLLERTAEDLQRYALKHYAVRRYLASDEERRASKLALLLLAGHRNVVNSC